MHCFEVSDRLEDGLVIRRDPKPKLRMMERPPNWSRSRGEFDWSFSTKPVQFSSGLVHDIKRRRGGKWVAQQLKFATLSFHPNRIVLERPNHKDDYLALVGLHLPSFVGGKIEIVQSGNGPLTLKGEGVDPVPGTMIRLLDFHDYQEVRALLRMQKNGWFAIKRIGGDREPGTQDAYQVRWTGEQLKIDSA